jgi:hypothetical protein
VSRVEKCCQKVQDVKSWRLVLQNSHIKLNCRREMFYKFPADASFTCDKDYSTAAMVKDVSGGTPCRSNNRAICKGDI